MSNIAIRAENLCQEYCIGERELPLSLRDVPAWGFCKFLQVLGRKYPTGGIS
jgi:hypothetical protein